jgi:serine/threonine protein kinase
MRSVEHANLIKLFAVYETENSIYMVMELLQGGNMLEYLKKKGKLDQKEALGILHGLLLGIEYLADRGLAHRDIKPENILFRNNEKLDPVLVDFGLATELKPGCSPIFVRCGTPGYVAPEVANSK